MSGRPELQTRGLTVQDAVSSKRETAPIASPIHQALLDAGLTMTTLRHWENAGIIVFARKAGRRIVDEEAVARLKALNQMRRAGFTVRQIIGLSPDAPPSLAQMRNAVERRLAQVRIAREVSLRRLKARYG